MLTARRAREAEKKARGKAEEAFGARVASALEKLDRGLRVGSWGQLQEWKADWDSPTNDHRHVSHLYALHPGRQISPPTTPALANAAKVSLTARGDGGTGWSKAWKINFWARLLDGDHAHKMLAEQLKSSTLIIDDHDLVAPLHALDPDPESGVDDRPRARYRLFAHPDQSLSRGTHERRRAARGRRRLWIRRVTPG